MKQQAEEEAERKKKRNLLKNWKKKTHESSGKNAATKNETSISDAILSKNQWNHLDGWRTGHDIRRLRTRYPQWSIMVEGVLEMFSHRASSLFLGQGKS